MIQEVVSSFNEGDKNKKTDVAKTDDLTFP